MVKNTIGSYYIFSFDVNKTGFCLVKQSLVILLTKRFQWGFTEKNVQNSKRWVKFLEATLKNTQLAKIKLAEC